MKAKNLIILVIICFFTYNTSTAQTWSLDKCIQYALDNNIQIKQNELSVKIQEVTLKQRKAAFAPNLNFSGSQSFNYGRFIDNTTNQFVNTQTRNNNFGLSSNVLLFNGFRIWNQKKQSEIDVKAANLDNQKIKNDIGLQVTSIYLNVLFAEEQIKVLKEQLVLQQKQFERTEKLVRVGSLPKSNITDLESQIATAELNILNSENSLEISYLTLKVALQLDLDLNIKVEQPDMSVFSFEQLEKMSSTDIYKNALETQPQVKSAVLKVESAEKSVKIAQAGMMPSLSMFGNINTNYSSQFQRATQIGTDTIPNEVGSIGGVPVIVDQPVPIFDISKVGFTDQIQDNISQNFGFSLQVPIFNQLQAKTSVERARLNKEIQALNELNTKNQLKQDVQKAYLDVNAAFKTLQSSEKALTASQTNYDLMQRRLDAGVVNAYELNNVNTTLQRAESDYIRAKYDYIFKIKILDFYQGKPLKL